MKKNILPILFIIIGLLVGFWWVYTYTYVKTITMIYNDEIEQNKYIIAPKYTELIITNNKDSAYIFYNENKKSVVIIKMDELKYIEFIKN